MRLSNFQFVGRKSTFNRKVRENQINKITTEQMSSLIKLTFLLEYPLTPCVLSFKSLASL